MSHGPTNFPTRDAPYITAATLEQARERTREDEPCVSHLALREWERMFDAWVKHQAGLPSDVPLWPNGDWSQDIAMVAHALAGIARIEQERVDASNDANRLAIRVSELEKELSSWKAVAHDHSERLKVLMAESESRKLGESALAHALRNLPSPHHPVVSAYCATCGGPELHSQACSKAGDAS